MSVTRRQLGEIADVYVGLPTMQSDIRGDGRSIDVLTVRALTGNDINPGELIKANLEKLRSQGREIDKYRALAGDVLVSARSTSLKTAIVPEELNGVIINATLIGVRCHSVLDARLLLAYLRHPEGQAALSSVTQSATSQMNITVSAIQTLSVPVPPIEVQQQLVQILNASDEAYQASLQAAETRRQLAIQIITNRLK